MNSLQKTNKHYLLLLLLSAIVCLSSLIFLRAGNIFPGSDYGVDVYYHVKVSDMFPFIATTKMFPWAEMSIWKTHFYDKELGFHFIIFILRKIACLFGISSDAPFNFISFCFFGFIIGLFSVWGYITSRKTAFLTILLLVFISPMFTQKLIIIRPALISITLYSLLIFLLISNYTFKRKLIFIFILGWLYSLCYSIPHIILLPLGIYFISQIVNKGFKKNLKYALFPVTGVLGVLVGLTIHPQFPNTYLNWYIQGFLVVSKMFSFSGKTTILGAGMQAPGSYLIKMNILIFILMLLNIVLFFLNTQKNREKLFLVLLQTFTTIGFCFNNRFLEYAVPAEVICFTVIINLEQSGNNINGLIKLLSNKITKIAVAILLILCMIPINANIFRTLPILTPPYGFAEWAQKNLPENSYIGLFNWGDFPCLFYADSKLIYSMALDPMFSYFLYPERTMVIESFKNGNLSNITPQELSNALGTKYFYARKLYREAVFYLVERGAQPVYFDNIGCLLILPEPEKSLKGKY